MKKLILSFLAAGAAMVGNAQAYPQPEFTKEIYYLNKDSAYTVVRLEKSSSKMETKTKLGGFGGSESGYNIEGDKSPIRFHSGHSLSFVYTNSSSAEMDKPSPQRDSMMRANGMDPSMIKGMSKMMDPTNNIALYKVETDKNGRKIIIQKNAGATPFASHKTKSSDKFTFSVKEIRSGYWEFVVDKNLEKGEYAFSTTDIGMGGMGGVTLFCFGID